MIYGLGNDIVEVSRIQANIVSYGSRFLDRIYTSTEQAYCQRYSDAAPHFAGRFAAKEAIVKALGIGFGQQASWLDVEIINNDRGRPDVHLSDQLANQFDNPTILITISHCREYATATAIWTTKRK